MRIKRLFALGMGVICLFALALAGVVVAGEWARYRQSRTGLMMVEDYGKVLVAVDRVATERSPNQLWILAPDDTEKRANLDKARASSMASVSSGANGRAFSAMNATRTGYFGDTMKTLREVMAARRSNGQYPITSPQYREMNVDSLG
jgi:hypothetical protein